MWSGDSKYWGKKSPVLFPIVGGLKDNKYIYNGKTFQLSRHGFARDQVFTYDQSKSTESVAYFYIESSNETFINYPFTFKFTIKYSLTSNRLDVSYIIENHSESTLLFSVGAHPAFKVPLVDGTTYNDWVIEFSSSEDAGTWPLTASGLIESNPIPLINNSNTLPLTKELFYNDALIFKNLKSDNLAIKSTKSYNGIKVSFPGFPYLGIWAAKDADFVCIEPWLGIADSVNSNNILAEKEGIISINKSAVYTATWTAEFY
eukprot:gene17443-22995_t